MDNRSAYIDALQRRLDELKDAIGSEQVKARDLVEAIGSKEEQVAHIIQLLAAEGVRVRDASSGEAGRKSVSDMAYELLADRPEQEPIHYRDLADLIMAEGEFIPGRNPGANLISHLSRDERFVRTGRGTYGLASWGLKPPNKRTRRRRRTTKKSRAK
jgi:hypothetical protein